MGGRSRYVRLPGRRTSALPRPQPRCPRSWSDEVEEEWPSHDYSTIEVLDMEDRYADTGLVYPDGEPVYRENGAEFGFPITSDREEERE